VPAVRAEQPLELRGRSRDSAAIRRPTPLGASGWVPKTAARSIQQRLPAAEGVNAKARNRGLLAVQVRDRAKLRAILAGTSGLRGLKDQSRSPVVRHVVLRRPEQPYPFVADGGAVIAQPSGG
jgi:hypothetical protein